MRLAQIDFNNIKIPVDPNVGAAINLNDPSLTIGSIINSLLPYIFVVSGLAVLIYLIYGGYHMIIAAGDQKGLQEARAKLTNALIGFVIIFAAYWLVIIIGKIFKTEGWAGFF